jgi:hypothetical protein
MKLSPITPGPHALHDLIRPAGSAPIPLDFEAAEALDAQARAAYAAGDYRTAADLFVRLAELLVTAQDAPHATTLATDREYARRNAAAASAMAQELDEVSRPPR